MNKTTHIILIATTNPNAREYANIMEGNEILVHTDKSGEVVHTKVRDNFPDLKYDEVQVYSLHDFMELNNNEDYHADDWFITYAFTY